MGHGHVSPLGQHFCCTEGWQRARLSTEHTTLGSWPPGVGGPPQTFTMACSPQGSFKELVYVFFMLKDAGLTPDLLSYAAALQCMGRLDRDASTVQRWVACWGQRCDVAGPGRVARTPGRAPWPPVAETWRAVRGGPVRWGPAARRVPTDV